MAALFAASCEGGGEDAVPPAAEPHPSDGEGAVRVFPRDPVPASSRGSWTVEWIAGPSGVASGGGAVLQVSPFWGWSPPQVSVPGVAGYTTVHCSAPGVPVEAKEGGVPMTVVARVGGRGLVRGDTLRFVYGDSSRGGVGSLARADRYAEAFEELLVKTDGNGDGVFVAPGEQPVLTILPGPAKWLAVAAPVVAAPGTNVRVAIHALDAAENRATLPPGAWTLRARPLAEGAEALPAVPETLLTRSVDGGEGAVAGVSVRTPGIYRLEAVLDTDAGGRLRGSGDILLVEEDSPFSNILFGDIHCHSALSDGTGAPEDLYDYARDVSGLDVCAVTDHDAHGLFPLAERGGWERIRRATDDAYEPGAFVTLLGYEWTNWVFGHRNVYYPALAGDVFDFRDPGSDSPPELWERIAPFGGMTIAHHTGGGPVPADWSVPIDEERERVVEICSIHGSSEAAGVERGIYRPVPSGMVRHALGLGHRLGILAAGDTHDGHPGRRSAGALAHGLAAFRTGGERTREAVWAALRDRRVYGTSGPRILLQTDWGGAPPGSILPRTPEGPLVVRVVAPEPVHAVELVGPSGMIESAFGGGRRVERRFFLEGPAPDVPWLYARVVLADGEAAWESPYWRDEERP